MRLEKGFTLVELLTTIALIAILMGAAVVILDPVGFISQGRNTQRETDLNSILNSVYQYSTDNNGSYPSSITTTLTEICKTGASSCSGLIDLSELTNNSKYLVEIPEDPLCPDQCANNGVGYEIKKTSNGRIQVTAPNAELDKTIEVIR